VRSQGGHPCTSKLKRHPPTLLDQGDRRHLRLFVRHYTVAYLAVAILHNAYPAPFLGRIHLCVGISDQLTSDSDMVLITHFFLDIFGKIHFVVLLFFGPHKRAQVSSSRQRGATLILQSIGADVKQSILQLWLLVNYQITLGFIIKRPPALEKHRQRLHR
jgi:hypothetical protein